MEGTLRRAGDPTLRMKGGNVCPVQTATPGWVVVNLGGRGSQTLGPKA